ncbi:hypothetical protein [Marisediminicola senii]|nr:hypothetical protein [Marisediminicola senii]
MSPRPSLRGSGSPWRNAMLDLVYLAGTAGLFGLLALIAWAVEKL